MQVLICDGLDPKGIDIFQQAKGIETEVHDHLPKEELLAIIDRFDGLVVRSRTKVDHSLLAAAKKLRVVGRAGTGVDNIDVQAATELGVLVMNTPGANAMAAAEHTMALLLALARHIPQADHSLRHGRWDKKAYVGTELYGQTMGVVGLGKIGTLVAERALGFKMRVLAYDPYISAEAAAKLGVELIPLDKLWRQADFITLHTPFSRETKNLLDETALKKVKRGARVINCARGGLIDEAALCAAIQKGRVAGAALDVFAQEPPFGSPLLDLPQVIVTPHLGASSEQAQVNVAVAIANQMIAYLQSGVIQSAVNVPSIGAQVLERVQPYMVLAARLGAFLSQCFHGSVAKLRIAYCGDLWDLDLAPVTHSALQGFLARALDEHVNIVNAPAIMRRRGIEVEVVTTPEVRGYSRLISLTAISDRSQFRVDGSVFPEAECRVVQINDYRMESPLHGRMLLIANYDRPGVIGVIGSTLGAHGVNIADMHLSRAPQKGRAISLVAVDGPVPPAALAALTGHENIISVHPIDIQVAE